MCLRACLHPRCECRLSYRHQIAPVEACRRGGGGVSSAARARGLPHREREERSGEEKSRVHLPNLKARYTPLSAGSARNTDRWIIEGFCQLGDRLDRKFQPQRLVMSALGQKQPLKPILVQRPLRARSITPNDSIFSVAAVLTEQTIKFPSIFVRKGRPKIAPDGYHRF